MLSKNVFILQKNTGLFWSYVRKCNQVWCDKINELPEAFIVKIVIENTIDDVTDHIADHIADRD